MGNYQSNSKDDKEPKKYEKPTINTKYNQRKRARFKEEINFNKSVEIFPLRKCKLRQLRLERVKDFLVLQKMYVAEQEERIAKKVDLKDDKENLNSIESQQNLIEVIRGESMMVGTLDEMIDDNHAIISTSVGLQYYVNILSFVDRALLEPNCTVLVHQKALSVIGILQGNTDQAINVMKVEKAPLEKYSDVGGLEKQIQELKEAVELPMTHPELYDDVGVRPPKGVIFYGRPGTGKTLLAKAVASETSATFLRIVGSELIQKYLGDGPKLVRELFRAADDNAPSIVFIDEIDAVGTKRYSSNSGGTREVQRTMLELLNQLDGFDARGEVKVIMATNRIETLDPALLRPGRIDRKIEFGLPDAATRRKIFEIHTAKMTLAPDVKMEEVISAKSDLSGADIKAICTEAGLIALRGRSMQVTHADFVKAKETALYRKKEGLPEKLYI